MRTIYIAVALVLVAGAVVGYTVFYAYNVLDLLRQEEFQDNFTYEQASFASHVIAGYNITINTQLPQIVKNPIWKTPIKVYIDTAEAQKRKLPERPIEGLRKAMLTLTDVTNGTITFLEVSDANEADVLVNFTFNFSDEHAVGEGGPTLYIRTGEFTVIKKGEVRLLPVEYECTSYTLAVHELGHVLGFGHSSHYNSVMWPKYGCLTNNLSEIIHDVAELYKHYKADIAIGDARATTSGKLVNLFADIENIGPKEASSINFIVYFDGKKVHEEKIESLDVGYSVKFKGLLPVTQPLKEIRLEAVYGGEELTKLNNALTLQAEEI
jgi:hypothetical protein